MTKQVAKADAKQSVNVPQTPCETLKSNIKAEIERLQAKAGDSGGFPNVAYREVTLTPDDAPQIREAISDMDSRLEPAGVDPVKRLLGWLSDRVAWPNELQDPADAKRNAEMLAEELSGLPYEAVARAVRQYPRYNKFWPSALAAIYEPAEQEERTMRRLRANLSSLAGAAERGPDNRRVGNVTYYDPETAKRHREQRADRGGFQPIAKDVKEVQ